MIRIIKELEMYTSIKVVSNSLSEFHCNIPPTSLKGGITEWYQVEC